MSAGRTHPVIHHLRRAVLLRDGAGLSDEQLLKCFIDNREQAAFQALVRRHGPLVWGVCQRVLRHHHDAEDAFQATFLVLARNGKSISAREKVASWLFSVAYKTAMKARALNARRRVRETQMNAMPEPATVQQDLDVWLDLEPILDQELARLPERYRVSIILCDLEGKTRKEAARALGWPEGTVAGRLARARAMLAKRLAGRGVTLSCGALAAALAQMTASASVPASAASSAINIATALASGNAAAMGAISAKVALLAEGALKTMLLTKLKVATAVLLAVGAAGMTGTVVTHHTLADQTVHPTSEDKANAPNAPAQMATPKTAPLKTAKPKADKAQLQGPWDLVSWVVQSEGKPDKDQQVAGSWTFSDAIIKQNMQWKLDQVTFHPLDANFSRYTLDETTNPKSIDLVLLDWTNGFKDSGEVAKGIYSIKDGTLTIRYSIGSRPTDLEKNAKGSTSVLIVLKRKSQPNLGERKAEVKKMR